MSFQGLQERLAQLQETTSQLKTLIDRLAGLKLQPGSVVPLADDAGDGDHADGTVVSELGADITQGLRETDEELELLREEMLDLRSGRPGSEAERTKMRLKDAADRLRQELKAYRIEFRKAQLSVRQKMATALRAERAALLASYATPPVSSAATTRSRSLSLSRSGASSPAPAHTRRRQTLLKPDRGRSKDKDDDSNDKVVGAAHDVTASLRRTHDLMAAELARSAYAAQALAESTAALRELDDRYAGLDGLLAASRSLLRTLASSQKSDTWYLRTTLYLLLATAAWLVFRRLMYGPLWWLVWVPLRVGWWSTRKGVSGGLALVGNMQQQGQQPAGARMEAVGTSGSTSVVGMAGDGGSAVPTARVGHGDKEKEEGSAGSDSMMDKVGKVIDGEVAAPSENGDSDAPNPKKRMWEEPVEVAQDASQPAEGEHAKRSRVKDEL